MKYAVLHGIKNLGLEEKLIPEITPDAEYISVPEIVHKIFENTSFEETAIGELMV